MAEVKDDAVELVVRAIGLKLWETLVTPLDYRPASKSSFLEAVYPEIRKVLYERTSREGGHPTSLVDQPQAVGGQLEPSVPYSAPPLPGEDTWGRIPSKPACEWGGGVCR